MSSEQMQQHSVTAESALVRYVNWAVIALIVLLVVLYRSVLEDLFSKWYAQDLTGKYSHGLPVAVIVLYLLYKITLTHRQRFYINPSAFGLVLLVGSQLAMLAVMLMEISFMQHVLFVVSLLAIVWSIYSYGAAKFYILPALLFSMTFPMWGDLATHLQTVSVMTTNALLSLTGLPYYREGALFHFPVGIIEIAPECAGLQQLLVSQVIGLLFGYQYQLRLTDLLKTLIYISIASILINTVRIIIIMIVGYFTKMESSLITQHLTLGWVIYGIGIFIFLFFYSKKKFKPVIDKTADVKGEHARDITPNHVWKIYFPVVLLMTILPSLSMAVIKQNISHHAEPEVNLILKKQSWKKLDNNWDINWRPVYPASEVSTRGIYTNGNNKIYIYVLTYTQLNNNAKPLNMVNTAYDPKHWRLTEQSSLDISTAADGRKKLRLDKIVSKNGEHLAVLRFYRVNGQVVDNLVKAKLDILTGLLHLNYRIDVVCLASRINPEAGKGVPALVDFYNALSIH